MGTKQKWTYKDDRNHFYKRKIPNQNWILANDIWFEFQDDEIVDTFVFKTCDSTSLIFYSSETSQYLELGLNKAKLTFGEIESLDHVKPDEFLNGYWDDSGDKCI